MIKKYDIGDRIVEMKIAELDGYYFVNAEGTDYICKKITKKEPVKEGDWVLNLGELRRALQMSWGVGFMMRGTCDCKFDKSALRIIRTNDESLARADGIELI